eukprot:g7611.t1
MCCCISRKYWRPLYCAICEKKSKKAYFRLKTEEKRKWSFLEGQGVCVECLLALEMGYSEIDQKGRYKPCFINRHTSSYKTNKTQYKRRSRLKKLDSGKAWERSRSFRAPYIESPSVTEKVAKLHDRGEVVPQRQGISGDVRNPVASIYCQNSGLSSRSVGSCPNLISSMQC